MFKSIAAAVVGLSLSLGVWAKTEATQELPAEIKALHWQESGKGEIADKASVKIPSGYAFLGEADTSKLLQAFGNPPSSDHFLIAPKSLDWFAVFSYDDTGYVKDDEKIDADDLLKSMQSGDKAGNEQRKKLGLEALYTDGWQVPPHYDTATKRLEWGLRLRGESGEKNVNYTSRILGRSGVMTATLVSDTATLAQNTEEFKKVLAGFDYNSGQTYAEFKNGDKVAAIGLGALVLGGAAAVATKKGLWGAIAGFLAAGWKIVAAAAVALFAGIGKLFGRKKAAE
ncbi:DUF2167 domain-containing protein [Comamonas testosteroni]|jgi:hypothetical protein|uniref:DUF2167 domain-containing protein n=2 Tax=Comamonas testosteroni TaxID=285 RepID=B7WUP9_COMTK|nr:MULTISPECIES: DUF2167 domain-containing protein [Comamonas]AIJ46876.1 membrane protein [Comamonas testosteroni TK102]EED67562.1 conserved hypothetical protein [Comamonas testosteroni KF-1]MPS89551.1 DUF2167 domain-containing protein [Comamonas sp.]TYK69910.1 DUF2167 domain-containing protein [Comamonas sp. Z3]WQG65708.1 DUF2167 domain-containing protein [Comamonas testosteroni]